MYRSTIHISFRVLVVTVVSMAVSVGIVRAQSPAVSLDIAEPTIAISPDIFYPLDEILYVEGLARPHASVKVELRKSGAKPIRLSSQASANGEWTIAERLMLEKGDWEIRAQVVENGATSAWSNPRIIRAVINGFQIGNFTIKFSTAALYLSLLFMAGLSLLVYGSVRVRTMRRREENRIRQKRIHELESKLKQKELEELTESVQKGFSEIRSDILEKGIAQGTLPQAQEESIEKLQTIQSKIEEEIHDVAKLDP